MQLRDRLGQVTTIRFTRLDRNPKLAADTFRFVPPADADVVGDR
jgi:outer membrane lipoprotein carrier protein